MGTFILIHCKTIYPFHSTVWVYLEQPSSSQNGGALPSTVRLRLLCPTFTSLWPLLFSSAGFSALIIMLCGKVASWELVFLARFLPLPRCNPELYEPDWEGSLQMGLFGSISSPDVCVKPQAKSSGSMSHKFLHEVSGKTLTQHPQKPAVWNNCFKNEGGFSFLLIKSVISIHQNHKAVGLNSFTKIKSETN